MSVNISDIPAREMVGRDTIARFNAQFRGAAIKSLQILEGGAIDRIYCDFQDDFVVRENLSGNKTYHFYQVKTKSKKNHLYTIRELFGLYQNRGLKSQNSDDISKSFVGLLLLHAVNFEDSCTTATFQTNINFDDKTEALINAIGDVDLQNKHFVILTGKFRDCFSCPETLKDEDIQSILSKLRFEPGLVYLHPDDTSFPALARDAIFKFSEVDLKYAEAKRIIANLVSLVEKKSFSQIIGQVSETELDDAAGIGLSDLLSILSISRGAYDQLIAGGDVHAIRNVSIIQRKLGDAGATDEMVEYASSCKAEWDTWVRKNRHYISELDFNIFLQQLDDVVKKWIGGIVPMSQMKPYIDTILSNNREASFGSALTQNLVLGGLLACVVKSEVQ